MLDLPTRVSKLFDTVPFPEHDDGLFTYDGLYTLPWQTEHCTGDLTVRLDDTDQPPATVSTDRTTLGTILCAAAETWPDTARTPTPNMTLRPAAEWLPAVLPLADGTIPETTDYYGVPLVRLHFAPAPGARLKIRVSLHACEPSHLVLASLHTTDYDTVTRYMQALHGPF
ncbi:hypothetical protein [Streptomyces sp. NPDC055140]